jgi:hypothetical protein
MAAMHNEKPGMSRMASHSRLSLFIVNHSLMLSSLNQRRVKFIFSRLAELSLNLLPVTRFHQDNPGVLKTLSKDTLKK